MRPLLIAIIIAIAILAWLGPNKTSPPPRVVVVPAVPRVALATPPAAGPEETRMAGLYRRKRTYLGRGHAEDVLTCGRWTRYYARKTGVEKHMATLLCMWHVESQFLNVPGGDGKSFGRTQTCYGYQPDLRRWWATRGEALPGDNSIQTQMAYGVAEFVIKQKAARGDLWSTVRRYNGCGPDAIAHARKVFAARDRIYGMGSPREKPAPCPSKRAKKRRAAKR